ncbi:MAG: hypothetical protein QQN63_12345, partial [Nitrosopumilus sp.]
AKIADSAFLGVNFAANSLNGKGDWNTVTPDAAGVAPTAAEVVNEWETQSQADPTGFHVNVLEVSGTGEDLPTATALATVDTNVDDLKLGIIFGAAASGTLTTTVATTNLSGYTDDQLIGRILVVTSGQADGEATDITDYANTNGQLTFTPLTLAMGNNDTFKIV